MVRKLSFIRTELNETTEHLEELLRQETAGPNFSPLPFNYMEIARVLLEAWVIDNAQME